VPADGTLIGVEYIPFTDLTPADLELLNAICDEIQLDRPSVNAGASEALRRSGLTFALERDWHVALPLDFVPGCMSAAR